MKDNSNNLQLASMRSRAFAFVIDDLLVTAIIMIIFWESIVALSSDMEAMMFLMKTDLVMPLIALKVIYHTFFVYIIMEAIKRAKELGCKVGVYGASTTGEETTKTGAFWTSTRINPTLAIVVDVTYTSDCSGMNPAEMGTVLLGGGPVLCNSPIVVKTLNAKMEECAKKVGIPVQREAASRLSYTDGDKIHFSNQGVPMVLVSIPLRYMHMPAEVADEKDVEGCVELIAQFLANYNA